MQATKVNFAIFVCRVNHASDSNMLVAEGCELLRIPLSSDISDLLQYEGDISLVGPGYTRNAQLEITEVISEGSPDSSWFLSARDDLPDGPFLITNLPKMVCLYHGAVRMDMCKSQAPRHLKKNRGWQAVKGGEWIGALESTSSFFCKSKKKTFLYSFGAQSKRGPFLRQSVKLISMDCEIGILDTLKPEE